MTDGDLEAGSVSVYLPPLLVIVGPTGVGKTAFSLQIAAKINAEIVSADSRLIYRGMDIGTDKPSAEERSKIPHHLIDICQPDERLSLGQYQRRAYMAIRTIHKRSKVPALVGGTGQYVQAVVQGWGIPAVAPQEELREALLNLGGEELARWLRVLDEAAAARIDPRNVRRMVRALEVTLVKGKPISALQKKTPPKLDINQIGITADRDYLYRKADARVDAMIENGLLEEVVRLRNRGFDRQLSSMSGLGYRQLLAYLDGEYTLSEAVERVKYETHRFIRQQSNWFRQDDPNISWFDVEESGWQKRATEDILNWLGANLKKAESSAGVVV